MAKKDKNRVDLPEVKDIPGQENAKPPRLGELADTTASSKDEEGDDTLEQDDQLVGPGTNVSREERAALARTDYREAGTEDDVLNEAALDSVDDDGDPLNEGSFGSDTSADDLDIPGDEDEDDEENSDYATDKNEDDSEINYDA